MTENTQHSGASYGGAGHGAPRFRVVTIAVNLPGPAAARRFRQLGAEVVKVEPPFGDPLKMACKPLYEVLNEGQDVRTLDLKHPAGRAELDGLLSEADIFLTSHRPAALERLGLDWESLHREFPRLTQVAIVGHSAEDADLAGHDLTYQAHAGTLNPPQLPLIPMADMAGSERAVSEGMAALWQVEQTGEGSYREVALADMAVEFSLPARMGLSSPGSLLGGALPQYGLYEAAEGWVAVALLEPHFLMKAVQLLELSPMSGEAEFRAVFAQKTAAEWDQWAAENSLPIAEVRQPFAQ